MKIKASHIVLAALVVFFGIIVAAYFQAKHARSPKSDFIEEILALQSGAPSTGGTGSLPPIDSDRGLVPKIELETTHLDMGVVRNDDVTHTTLKVFNRGKAPLKIVNIETTCACTLGNIPPDRATIEPGGEADIKITMNPFRIPGFHSRKTLTIFSTDPQTPTLKFEVEALVDPEFEMSPEEIDFGIVQKGETRESRMLIRQLQEAPLVISEVRSVAAHTVSEESPDILYAFEQRPEAEWSDPEKAEYWIAASLTPLVPPGPIQRYFSINTNLERMALMPGRLKGEVKAPYRIVPAFPQPLVLHDPTGRKPVASIKIQSETEIEIGELRFDSSRLSAVAQNEAGTDAWVIEVKASSDAPKGSLTEIIQFDVISEGVHYTEQVMVRGLVLGLAPTASSPE